MGKWLEIPPWGYPHLWKSPYMSFSFIMIITFIHFPSSASHPLLPWAAGRHVARKGRGTLNRSWQCFFCELQRHHYTNMQYVKNCVHPWPSITRPQQYSILHFSDSIINNPSKTSPSTNSINSQVCLHLPIFWHIFPSPIHPTAPARN